MMAHQKEMSSPSRTYVAMCVTSNFNGYYFRKFTLPEQDEQRVYENNADVASWYFLNVLDGFACIEGSMPYEHYQTLKEVQLPTTVADHLAAGEQAPAR